MPGPAELPEESPCVQQIPSSLKEAEFTSLFLFLAPSSLRAASCSSCPPCGFLSLVLHAAGAEPQTRDHLPVPPPPLSRGAWPPLARQPHTSNGTSSVGRSGEWAAPCLLVDPSTRWGPGSAESCSQNRGVGPARGSGETSCFQRWFPASHPCFSFVCSWVLLSASGYSTIA